MAAKKSGKKAAKKTSSRKTTKGARKRTAAKKGRKPVTVNAEVTLIEAFDLSAQAEADCGPTCRWERVVVDGRIRYICENDRA